jgi:tetratricopeptide (TPR) repeat protein
MVGALFATFAPTLGEYAASRLHRVKFGGFEVELSDAAGQASLHLTVKDVRPWDRGMVAQSDDDLPYDTPFPSIKLTGPGLYEYERLSLRLHLLFDQVKDPNELDLESRENLRRLILHVGKAAHAMQHYTKALEVLLWLKRFSDREPEIEESRMLGTAYLWAAYEQTDKSRRMSYQNDAIPYLRTALGKNPYQWGVRYNLGWALLSLDKYDNGIRQMKKCMRLEPRVAAYARWNIACGLKKLNRQEDALKTLEDIPAGPLWNEIMKDDWFKDPEQTPFMGRFQALAKTKVKPIDANPHPDMFC